MLLHCVFCALRADADPRDLAAVMEDLAALKGEVEGMLDFRHGPNRDYEAKSPRHGHGFVIATGGGNDRLRRRQRSGCCGFL